MFAIIPEELLYTFGKLLELKLNIFSHMQIVRGVAKRQNYKECVIVPESEFCCSVSVFSGRNVSSFMFILVNISA